MNLPPLPRSKPARRKLVDTLLKFACIGVAIGLILIWLLIVIAIFE